MYPTALVDNGRKCQYIIVSKIQQAKGSLSVVALMLC